MDALAYSVKEAAEGYREAVKRFHDLQLESAAVAAYEAYNTAVECVEDTEGKRIFSALALEVLLPCWLLLARLNRAAGHFDAATSLALDAHGWMRPIDKVGKILNVVDTAEVEVLLATAERGRVSLLPAAFEQKALALRDTDSGRGAHNAFRCAEVSAFCVSLSDDVDSERAAYDLLGAAQSRKRLGPAALLVADLARSVRLVARALAGRGDPALLLDQAEGLMYLARSRADDVAPKQQLLSQYALAVLLIGRGERTEAARLLRHCANRAWSRGLLPAANHWLEASYQLEDDHLPTPLFAPSLV